MARVYELDALGDPRWPRFLERHGMATVFHSPEWLEALRRTYGYDASVLTTSPPGADLRNGLVFCRVRSWLTGRRLIAVPFSDHCTPLIDSEEDLICLLSRLKQEADQGGEKYLEIRSNSEAARLGAGLAGSAVFCLHRLDLRPSLSELFDGFHHSCIRRKIARAQREGVRYDEGTSEEVLLKFFKLTVLTRRRQQIPPQPLSWFRNLVACFRDRLKIRLASKDGHLAAGILTIRNKGTMTYKYGCSDRRFHKDGPMQVLMWKAIQDAKESGLLEFDMGRSDWSNEGLLAFKDHWGATRSKLVYLRHPAPKPQARAEGVRISIARRMFALAPSGLLTYAGSVLYRHIA